MREQLLAAPNLEERFGDRSYAIISDKYLNFSSRVGYHYSVLDAYCGATVNKNYITFSFKGGAADDVRRSRRVRAIAIVLMGLDFSVEVKGDRVDARLQKYDSPVIQEKLDLIGRLLIFTRQMDMLMTSEAGVEAVAQNFLQGNYSLDMEAIADAGGLAEGAKESAVMITRKDKAGKEHKIRVNLRDIIKGKKKDILLQEGDVVYVPESFW